MLDSLREYLRFYRDLGFTEIYLPEGVSLPEKRSAPGSTASTVGIPAKESDARRGSSAAPDDRQTKVAAPSAARAPDIPTASNSSSPADIARPPARAVLAGQDALEVLQKIRDDMGECTLCRLHEGRSKIVFGSGNSKARLVFVGEGPGADEDAQGLPFVGRAGQLLTQMIENTASKEGIPIKRADVYICNVVKCRPPGNRTPEPDEMETCGKFLERQLEAIRPKAICLLGATAARFLLGTRVGITKLRGQWQEWRGIPVMPTYHPSFLLRPYAQDRKREAWEDFKKVLHFVYDPD